MLKQLVKNNSAFWDAFSEIDEYKNPNVAVRESVNVPEQKALLAEKQLSKDEVVFVFTGNVTFERTRTSIQVDFDKHVEAGDFGSFANHSCEPNCVVRSVLLPDNKVKVVLVTIRPVEKGEELTFDYATTETDLTVNLKKMKCLCNSKKCRGKVFSFSVLDVLEKHTLKKEKMLTDFLQNSKIDLN